MFEERESDVAVIDIDREEEQQKNSKRKPQPRYNVVLWDDNDHTYSYVIRMLRSLFNVSHSRAYQLARAVDDHGRCICLTTSFEHAELKRDQIHSFGKDHLVAGSAGSMSSSIEPVADE
ncbi:MAG: ATP-dependent Clp protease adaptor ClpS [Planctomycetales bacterium]|nr:ATP-dependent Clp protease adaptor ClpS [Planctomycetales bacterium]